MNDRDLACEFADYNLNSTVCLIMLLFPSSPSPTLIMLAVIAAKEERVFMSRACLQIL